MTSLHNRASFGSSDLNGQNLDLQWIEYKMAAVKANGASH